MVDALALGASGATCGGSSPLSGTVNKKNTLRVFFVILREVCLFPRALVRRDRGEFGEWGLHVSGFFL